MSVYRRSIWVFHLNTGSCNACDIEILDVLTPYHDVERFGIKLVASPRHADALLLTGPITRESLPKVIDALLAVPEPKLVIAIGSCTCCGGIWYDTYSTLGGLNELYRVLKEEYGILEPPTVKVPGCPPRPEAIIYGVALALGIVKQKYSTTKIRVE
jgi:Ni,Fe-hydrogenase III small subunit